MNKKVTVVMPVYNSEKYLKSSVSSILNQSYKNIELLAINDGSTDSSLNILENFRKSDERVRIVNNIKNKGLPYTRKLGLKLAKGEYIALLDSDDISKLSRIEEQVKYLDENMDVMVVATDFDYLINDKIVKVRRLRNYNIDINEENTKLSFELMFYNPILNSSAMFRNDFIKKYNIDYKNDFFVAQDYMFWVDCIILGKFHIINKKLILYRKGHENITKTSSETKKIKRKKLIDKIRLVAIENNGFNLISSDVLLFNKVFSDPYVFFDKNDIYNLYEVINKMSMQINNKKKKSLFINIAKNEIMKRVKSSNFKLIDKIEITINRFKYESVYTTTFNLLKLLI